MKIKIISRMFELNKILHRISVGHYKSIEEQFNGWGRKKEGEKSKRGQVYGKSKFRWPHHIFYFYIYLLVPKYTKCLSEMNKIYLVKN